MPVFSEKSEAIALTLDKAKAFSRETGREIQSPGAAAPLFNAGILDKATRRRGRGGPQITVYWLKPGYGREFVGGLKGLRCRHCRCTELNPCKGGCGWVTKTPPVCSAPACIRRQAREMIRRTKAARRS